MAFVERTFSAPEGEVLAHFEAPYLAPGGEYRCRWRIQWPNRNSSQETAGIDSIQALMLAMRRARLDLEESDYFKAGTLTYLDQTDLDLPPGWGLGPLYDSGRPPVE